MFKIMMQQKWQSNISKAQMLLKKINSHWAWRDSTSTRFCQILSVILIYFHCANNQYPALKGAKKNKQTNKPNNAETDFLVLQRDTYKLKAE